MPGRESLRQQQYYAHPRNAFWSIIESRFKGGDSVGQLASSNADYLVRVQALLELKLAVWDVLANCERPGSLDSSIVRGSETYNPLPELVGKPPDLRAILFNGQKAHTLFERSEFFRSRPRRRRSFLCQPLQWIESFICPA